ncbi:MAG: hypothetical protein WDA09_10185, partial [Bacteriovoracaceae bacterium]
LSISEGYKIISEIVSIEHVWWDGNSINEFGFDDGKDYAYKDTKNNKKLTDTIVKDEDGNIIPPSKRFNYRSDTLFQKAPPIDSDSFKAIFKDTKAVNNDGTPAILYHGSPIKNLEFLDNSNQLKVNGGEEGYTYATDSYEAADGFAYEQLPGSSSFTYVPGKRGQIYEVYFNIKNPLDFRSLTSTDIENIKDAARKYGPFGETVASTLDDFINKRNSKYSLQFIKRMAEDIVNHLEEYGYDGLITELDNKGNLEYAAVSPSQVYLTQTESFHEDNSFDDIDNFNTSSTLYQLSEEEKRTLLEARKSDVKTAIENYYWVPTEILTEYAGEEWADNEINFREHLRNFPWALEEARKFMNTVDENGNYPVVEDFLDYIKEQQTLDPEVGDYQWILEDELWYKRIYEYAKIKSPDELDRQFVRYFTRSNEMLLSLGNRLKGYVDVNPIGRRSNRRKDKGVILSYKWGSFKGVSTIVKRLKPDSPQSEFDRAKSLVIANPRPYRKALMIVDEADSRVQGFRGFSDSDGSRDAYYESLGEELAEALNEPILLNEMTDRETAQLLRTTDDKKIKFDAREKLATRSGVIALERQADAELKSLSDQFELKTDSLKRELERLKLNYRITAKRYNEQLKEAKEKSSLVPKLKRDLADRRGRVAQLWSQLSELKKENKKLLKESTANQRREESRKLREKIDDLIDRVKRSTKFTDSTMDVSFAGLFSWVRQRLGLEGVYEEEFISAPWELKPEILTDYIPAEVMNYLNHKVPLDKLPVKVMEELIVGLRIMARDARVQQNKRVVEQGARRDSIQLAYYRQSIGKSPEMNSNSSVSYLLAENLAGESGKANNRGFGKDVKTANAWFMKIQRLARMLDGNTEGVLYDLLVRATYLNQKNEFSNADERIEREYVKRKELKISDESLQQDLYTYTPVVSDNAGKFDSITLTRDQVIGVYIFAKHEVSRSKLLDKVIGNKMTELQISEAI